MNAAEQEIRILSPTGVCGSGFVEGSFEKALSQEPHFIGCDAGSTGRSTAWALIPMAPQQ